MRPCDLDYLFYELNGVSVVRHARRALDRGDVAEAVALMDDAVVRFENQGNEALATQAEILRDRIEETGDEP